MGLCLYSTAILICCGAAGLIVEKGLSRFWNPPPFYSDFLGSLQVVDSHLNWVQTKDGPRIYVTGILTNLSAFAWKDVEFECRFFDATGAMVDAANVSSRFTIQPSDDSAFRAAAIPGHASNEYRSFRISVSAARNTRSPF